MSSPAQVVLRPIGTPLPLGFLGLFVATTAFSALQLAWLPAAQGSTVALAVLGLTVPVQLVACVFGFLARDPVAGTGMGVLAGTWAAAALATLTSPPGANSPGLGVVLLGSGAAMLVPAVAARAKLVPATVMLTSAVRYAVTGVAEISGSTAWLTAAGVTGLVLGALSLYAALALELESTEGRAVLPLLRRGSARLATHGTAEEQLEGVEQEPGVRRQL
jgi:uncharacterized protein